MQVTDNNHPDPENIFVSAILLAAGRSTRMAPVNKLTSDFGGKPLVRHAAEAAINSKAGEVLVVTGHDADAVSQALRGLDLRMIANPAFAEGLASSVKAGIAAVSPKAAGAVFLLGDMPRVTSDTVDALVDAFRQADGKKICQPRHDGRPGNPILWPRDLFEEFTGLSGDVGAKPLLARHADRVLGVDVDTGGIHMDVDAPADLTT